MVVRTAIHPSFHDPFLIIDLATFSSASNTPAFIQSPLNLFANSIFVLTAIGWSDTAKVFARLMNTLNHL